MDRKSETRTTRFKWKRAGIVIGVLLGLLVMASLAALAYSLSFVPEDEPWEGRLRFAVIERSASVVEQKHRLNGNLIVEYQKQISFPFDLRVVLLLDDPGWPLKLRVKLRPPSRCPKPPPTERE